MTVKAAVDSYLSGEADMGTVLTAAYGFLGNVSVLVAKDNAVDEEDIRSEVLLFVPEMVERYELEGVSVESQLAAKAKYVALDMMKVADRRSALLGAYFTPQEGVDCELLDFVDIRDSVDRFCEQDIWGFAFKDILELKLTGGYVSTGEGNPFAYWGNRLGFTENTFRNMFSQFVKRFQDMLGKGAE